MSQSDPFIHVPSWSQRPSGLLVPTGDTGRPSLRARRPQPPAGLSAPRPNIVIIGRYPSAWDQFGTYPDETALGLPRSEVHHLGEMAAALPFELSMLSLARIAAHVPHLGDDLPAQLTFAHEVFDDPVLVRRLARFVKSVDGRAHLFPSQHIAAWQRLLVLYAGEVALGDAPPANTQVIFNRAFYALGALTEKGDLDSVDGEAARSRWLAFLIQNGVYNASDPTLESMTRPQVLFLDVADDYQDHRDFCDVDGWFVEDYGLDIGAQYALGIAVMGVSHIREEDLGVHERSVIGPAFLPDIAARIGHDEAAIRDLIAAPRSWYAEQFTRGDQTESRWAWERTPFDKRPLLELAGGQLLVLSPDSLDGWLSEGFYHRALASARKRDEVPRLQRFYGLLVERYVLQTLQAAHPEPRPPGSGRVTGDRPYGPGGGKRTPDVCIDCGLDLVIAEVASGRFTLPTLIDGDVTAAALDLERLVFGKLAQLGGRIADLLVSEWQPPDVALADVQRIWPVLVTSNVVQNELLWDEIDERSPTVFEDPRVQPLTLLDHGDVEQLAALVEHGFSIADLIRRKATGLYARLDFRRFVIETPDLPHEVRLESIERRWKRSVLEGAQRLGFDVAENDLDERLAG